MVGPVPNQTAGTIDAAGRWFVESGIQEPFGGFARYYRGEAGKNLPVSTETTAYGISALVYLHFLSGDPRYHEAALRAGDFLLRSSWDPSLRSFPFEFGSNGNGSSHLCYFFDSGIIVRGLLALWRVGGNTELLRTAIACAESMSYDFRSDTAFHAILDLPQKTPLTGNGSWSRQPGCYQLKAGLAWQELQSDGHTENGTELYGVLLRNALSTHDSFLDDESDSIDFMARLHGYCYFLEGLWPATGDTDCANLLASGIRRVESRVATTREHFERSDVYAQLLRLRLFAAAMEILPLDLETAADEARRITEFQSPAADRRLHGGFLFARNGGELLPHGNPVSTAFSVQALEFWRQYQDGSFRPDWRTLI